MRKKKNWFEDKTTLRKRLAAFNAQGKRYGCERIAFEDLMEVKKLEGYEVCFWCGRLLAAKNVSFDHFHPLATGGAHSLSNMSIICRTCNLYKGATDPVFWNLFTKFLSDNNRTGWFFSQFTPSKWRGQYEHPKEEDEETLPDGEQDDKETENEVA